jgi:uncharacterized protein YndB with AHSA1/START domain
MTATKSRLQLTLPSDTEIVMTRVFDAPRRLVFEAHSKPEHLRHWWGPREFTMALCEMDFRPGGKWRYVLRSARGDFAFRGEFREIVAPERIVWTFEFEGAQSGMEKGAAETWDRLAEYVSTLQARP